MPPYPSSYHLYRQLFLNLSLVNCAHVNPAPSCRCLYFIVLYPSISAPPAFDGPLLLTNGTFPDLGLTDLTDFYFECRIQYRRVTVDDGARFDVVLTFDGEIDMTTLKTVTSLQRTVVFHSAVFRGHFGTDVSKLKTIYYYITYFL